ncbi:MAG: hypothetical protein LBD23_12695 [Oscillospiraceae bacterium]|jgi:hypothetical protein|nr:hypothetical protein [Oscillospiraceae bacterium]
MTDKIIEENEMTNVEEFLNDLTELTVKHGIIIGGCGCCGSPFLYGIGDKATLEDITAENLDFDKKTKMYTMIPKTYERS